MGERINHFPDYICSMSQPFTVQERVRWIDCDAAQIIYYGAYVRFFEIAEMEMYRSIGLPYSVAFKEIDCFPIRRAYHCEYLSPSKMDDLMNISIWISHWGNTTYTLSFRFNHAETGELLAEGYCRLVTVDRETKKKVPIPERLRRDLARHTVIPPAEAGTNE
jgi:YbgC/YbaW family acyl-CoA thioester hydrolase